MVLTKSKEETLKNVAELNSDCKLVLYIITRFIEEKVEWKAPDSFSWVWPSHWITLVSIIN